VYQYSIVSMRSIIKALFVNFERNELAMPTCRLDVTLYTRFDVDAQIHEQKLSAIVYLQMKRLNHSTRCSLKFFLITKQEYNMK
jgi:hypothetical protein